MSKSRLYGMLMDYVRELLLQHPRIDSWVLHKMIYDEPAFRDSIPWAWFGRWPRSPWVDEILAVYEMKGWVRLRQDDTVEVVFPPK